MPGQTTTIVIFGASGDLTTKKLAPALADLYSKGRLGPEVHIVGVSRSDMTADEFRASFYEGVGQDPDFPPAPELWDDFAGRIHSCYGDVSAHDGLRELERALASIESPDRPANRLYYLALAPFLFAPAVAALGRAGYQTEDGCWRRVVVEKPFGVNLDTAHLLNEAVHSVFAEHQVYRIDHYLGKETVQNLLVFRFANAIFEPIWSRNYIDNVQITVAESVSHRRKSPLLRSGRRAPGHVSEPPAAVARGGGHGTALHLRGRHPAQREGEGAGIRAPHSNPSMLTLSPSRASTTATSTNPASPAIPAPPPTPPCVSTWTTGAGRVFLFTSAPASL